MVTTDESHIGPGVAFGAPDIIMTKVLGAPATQAYITFYGLQRGGAVEAVKYSGSDPVQIAHVMVGAVYGLSKGGGGVQPDHDAAYSTADAADILKAKFVDHSKVLGVDLSNGS